MSSNHEGIGQIYAWDLATGSLEVKTDSPAGKGGGALSADGKWVLYHKDSEGPGSEIGHYVKVAWDGGEPGSEIDITPDLPPYAASGLAESKDGRILALCVAVDGGQSILIKAGLEAPPTEYHRVDTLIQSGSLELSPCGRYLAQASNEHTVQGGGQIAMDFQLNVYDLAKPSGSAPLATLWDGDTTSVSNYLFAPTEGAVLLAGTTSATGFDRPFLWEPLTDTRTELGGVEGIPGQLAPVCWSEDGGKLLLRHSDNGASSEPERFSRPVSAPSLRTGSCTRRSSGCGSRTSARAPCCRWSSSRAAPSAAPSSAATRSSAALRTSPRRPWSSRSTREPARLSARCFRPARRSRQPVGRSRRHRRGASSPSSSLRTT